MLAIDEETTSSSQWSSTHLEELNGRVCGEHEVLVRLDEHEDDDEGAADNHPVGEERNGSWREHRAQVHPPADRWRQLTDALVFAEWIIIN